MSTGEHHDMDEAERNWHSFASEHEYNALDEAVSTFDTSRGAMYAQLALVMHGEGGETQFEAGSKLEQMIITTANNFSDAAQTIMAHTPDFDDASEMILNLFHTDESYRIELLKELNPDGEYATSDRENMQENIEMLRDMDEHMQHHVLEQLYGQICSIPLNECLEAAPDNKYEMEMIKQNRRQEIAKRTAYDIAKMAGAALIAVALTSRRKK